MKRKITLGLAILFCLQGLVQIKLIADEIAQRGWGGTNYGRVFFPLIISGVLFVLYRKWPK